MFLSLNAAGDSIVVEGQARPTSSSLLDGYIIAEYVPTISTPQGYLRHLAGDDYDLLNCIARKESKWQMIWNYMHDVDPVKYTAYGYFQILESTARGIDPTLDRMKPFDNVELAVKIYRKWGIEQWLVWPQCVGFVDN